MEADTYQVIKCPLCSGKGDFYTTKNDCDFYKCSVCSLLFVPTIPENLEGLYDSEYFESGSKKFGYIGYDEDKKAMDGIFKKYLDIVEKHIGNKKGKLLDVGSATGYFLSLAKKRGHEVEGVEISPWAVKKGREKGIKMYQGTLKEGMFLNSSFDVVTLLDVFEHFKDPLSILKIISELLSKEGILVITTPDSGSLWAKILGKRWQALVPPEHLHLFNPNNIKDLLNKSGFDVLEIRKIGKKFTLGYLLYILFGRKILDSGIVVPLNTGDNMFVVAQRRS